MTSGRFAYFVILAGMRTGSNLLEERLGALGGVETFGEVFNPHFVGKPNQDSLLGISRKARDADPVAVINRMLSVSRGLPGFRLFRDHDPRVLDHVLGDPRAAKIFLRRNPLESYVSLKIAQKTGQWWMGDVRRSKTGQVTFDPDDFAAFLSEHSHAETLMRYQVQITGQTAFEISYEDLADPKVIAGLAMHLGLDPAGAKAPVKAKVQNPSPLSDKVTNFAAMQAALGGMDPFGTDRWPSFEPDYLPGLKAWRVGQALPLVFAPLNNGTAPEVVTAMAGVDGDAAPLAIGTQAALRKWKRTHPGHRSFTVVRHPVDRAWDAYRRYLMDGAPEPMERVQAVLRESFHVDLGGDLVAGFLGTMGFIKANLSRQTALAPRPAFGAQSLLLEAVSGVMPPDVVIRRETFGDEFQSLVGAVGAKAAPAAQADAAPLLPGASLAEAYNKDIEAAVKAAYPRDYMMFGYGRWDQAA
ncbi:MAG: nodulation protein NodH [Pseudomonadota bacterium]